MNHAIVKLPQELQDLLEAQVTRVRMMRNVGQVCGYEQFVQNLFKQFPGDVLASLHHATTGIAGEGGELLDASKKGWVYGKELDYTNLVEELGDLRFYYQALLNMLGVTDEEVKCANMHKLSLNPNARYPGGVYSDQAAIARADKVAPAVTTAAELPAVDAAPSPAILGAKAFEEARGDCPVTTLVEVDELLAKVENPFPASSDGHHHFRHGFLTAGVIAIQEG